MSRVVLASGSPIRAELLKRAGIAFEVEVASVDEAEIRNALKAGGATAEERRCASPAAGPATS